MTATYQRTGRETEYSAQMQISSEKMLIAAQKAITSMMEELGSSCSAQTNGDENVHGGEEPYSTLEDVNSVMVLGDSLARTPWGTNAKDNRSYYIADTGHDVKVKARAEGSASKEQVLRVQQFLEDWMKENDWKPRQSETSIRLDKHGEAWDMLFYDPDGILRVNFGEPTDVTEDPKSPYYANDAPQTSEQPFTELFGVRRTNDLRYRPVAYCFDELWYSDLRYVSKMGAVPDFNTIENGSTRTVIQQRKRNVLANDPRGLTIYWPVREELIFAKKLLANLIRVSSFQAAFGAIRTINATHSQDAVREYLASAQTGGGSSGQSEKHDFPSPAVVTVPASIKYDFPETGAGNANHIELLINLLRACASGMKLPEFMLTANVSEGNFASTLVSEGPFHKGMKFEQSLMVAEDERILWQAMRYAASVGGLGISPDDLNGIMLEIKPPRVQTRNRMEDFEVHKDLYDRGELSGKALVAAEGFDREAEQAERVGELQSELELPIGSSLAKTASEPGPTPGNKSDPVKEKGVSKGDPARRRQK